MLGWASLITSRGHEAELGHDSSLRSERSNWTRTQQQLVVELISKYFPGFFVARGLFELVLRGEDGVGVARAQVQPRKPDPNPTFKKFKLGEPVPSLVPSLHKKNFRFIRCSAYISLLLEKPAGLTAKWESKIRLG